MEEGRQSNALTEDFRVTRPENVDRHSIRKRCSGSNGPQRQRLFEVAVKPRRRAFELTILRLHRHRRSYCWNCSSFHWNCSNSVLQLQLPFQLPLQPMSRLRPHLLTYHHRRSSLKAWPFPSKMNSTNRDSSCGPMSKPSFLPSCSGRTRRQLACRARKQATTDTNRPVDLVAAFRVR